MTLTNLTQDDLEIIVGTYEDYVVGYQALTKKKMSLEQSFAVRGHSGSVRCLASSPDGSYICSAGFDEMINLFSLKRRKLLQTSEGAINCATFVGNKHLIGGSEDSNIYIYECQSNQMKLVKTLKGHKAAVRSIDAHPSGKILLSISSDQAMRTWNLIKGRCAYVTSIKIDAHLVKWSRTGNEFVIAANNEIYLYNNLGNLKQSIKMDKRVNAIEFINDQIFAVAIDSGRLEFFDLDVQRDSQSLLKLDAHESRIKSIRCLVHPKQVRESEESDADDEDSSDESTSADSDAPETLFVTASSDGSVKVWAMVVKGCQIHVEPREVTNVDVGARLTCMMVSVRKSGR